MKIMDGEGRLDANEAGDAFGSPSTLSGAVCRPQARFLMAGPTGEVKAW